MRAIETLKRFEKETKQDLEHYIARGDQFCVDRLNEAMDDIKMAIDALEKQISREVFACGEYCETGLNGSTCGQCGGVTICEDGWPKYCCKCGQKTNAPLS